MQPHWVSALAWPTEEAETLWCGEPKDLLLVGRMDGSLGLIEVLDSTSMQRTELEHCYRKDGRRRRHAGAGPLRTAEDLFCPPSVAVVNIAWSGEDKPFTVAYADGKLLVGSKERLENGAIVVIDAHQVSTYSPGWTHHRTDVLVLSSSWSLILVGLRNPG